MSARLNALRERQGQIVDKMEALLDGAAKDNRDLNETEAQAFKDLETDLETTKGSIAREERVEALKTSLAKPLNVPDNEKIVVTPGRTAKLKNFRGPDAEKRAHRFGQFALAAIFGSEKAFIWCKEHGVTIAKAHSEGVATAGGYLVPDEFSTDIIDLRDEYGMFRRLCTPYPMGRDTINVPRRTGGLTAYAVGEGSAITESQASWNNVALTARKWGVLTLLSSELDEDAAVQIGDILVGEIAYAFAIAEDTAGFAGDGSGTYHGIKGFRKLFEDGLGTLAGSVDAASGHDTFAEIDATDLATVMAKLPQYAYMRGRPTFYCSQVAWALVFQRLIQASGGISKDDATGSVIYRYHGFPVEITPSMPAVTSDLSDKAMILFGDIGLAAAFGDRRGMTIARSTEYKFAEDQIAIKGTERFDINIHDIGDTTTPGPVVALMGE